jgi:hypothetical protein
MSNPMEKLNEIQAQFEVCKEQLLIEVETADEENQLKEPFNQELRKLCALIRETENKLDPEIHPELWDQFMVEAQRILDDAIEFARGEKDVFPYMPSFAHTPDSDASPEVKDPFSKQPGNALGSKS